MHRMRTPVHSDQSRSEHALNHNYQQMQITMTQTSKFHQFPPVEASAIRVPFLDLKAQYASIRHEILDAVHEVLESARYVGGESVERFELEFARYVGARHAIAVSSGTVALELVFRALGLGAGDEVIVPANTFIATAEAVSNVGAIPVFADVDPLTHHLDTASAERAITPRTRAIVPVHLYGRAMDLTEIEQLAAAHNLFLVEDACQAHGARHEGRRIGGSRHPACFSFYPGKNLGACGDAGAITCNDPHLTQQIRLLRDHGSPAKYEHVVVGTNARIDSVQAAVLSVKLRWLDEWNGKRVRHAKAYIQAFNGMEFQLPVSSQSGSHNFHLFVIRTNARDEMRAYLSECGIETGIHYPTPVHLTTAYRSLGYASGSLPVAESLAREVLSLPMFAELSRDQVRHVIGAVQEFMIRQPKPQVA
jgi:dTDP-4-amino-4,6-dideoxygalactose transaminase